MRDLYHDELDDIGNSLVAMTHLAGTAMERASNALLDGDLNGAERVVSDDTAIDALRADLEARPFALLSSPNWAHGTEAAIDMALLGRYYERYADHAVGVARRIVFIATGEMPAGSAAPGKPNGAQPGL